MKIHFVRTKNLILISLVGILGLSASCSKDRIAPEYGCPIADFSPKDVISSDTNNATEQSINTAETPCEK